MDRLSLHKIQLLLLQDLESYESEILMGGFANALLPEGGSYFTSKLTSLYVVSQMPKC